MSDALFSQFTQEEFEEIVYTLQKMLQYKPERDKFYWISDLYDSYMSSATGGIIIIARMIPNGKTLSESDDYRLVPFVSPPRCERSVTEVISDIHYAICKWLETHGRW